MNTTPTAGRFIHAIFHATARTLVVAGFLLGVSARAQMPGDGPTNIVLESWSFFDPTNWYDDDGYSPISFTNIASSSLGDDSSAFTLVVDTNVPAWLQYNVVENDGTTNLTVDSGTVTFWFGPNWSSTCDTNGGFGPGEYGRLLEVGSYTPDSSYGWWSIYVDDVGNNLYFSAQTNDLSSNVTTYVTAPIDWTTNYFHFVALTYCATGTVLYMDGVYTTNGPGVTVYPGPSVLTNGFWIGSDSSGIYQAHGMFDLVATYGYPMNSNDVWLNYQNQMWPFRMNPNDIAMFSSVSTQSVSYGTNLSLSTFNISNNLASLFVVNTGPDILYEIQACTNLSQGNWFSEGFLDGSELTNWTLANVPISKQGSLFLRIRSWVDSTGTGIPDWWWLQYFGQITNVNAYATDPAGDGFTDLQKFQMGLNPNIYYNPNGPPGFFGCLDASGTNAFLEWSNAPGPVINYIIQRGIQDTNGNYAYSQIGLVSSNATFFEDVGAITNANAQNNIYNLEAVYPGGSISATDSWTVWWYPNDGSLGPPYGPPPPGNLYAYADATGTNVLLSWTAAQGATINSIILHGIYNSTNYAYTYTQITNVISTATTNFEIFNAITNGANWTDVYEVEAVYPGGGLSIPASSSPISSSATSINVGANTNGPAAPGNFYGYTDATGTNIFLTWTPVSGAVTNYIIYGGNLDGGTGLIIYQQIAKLNNSTTNFEVAGGIDGSGNNLYYIYNVVAVYTNRSLSQSASWLSGNGAPTPGALSAYLDSTGTNVLLAWTPAAEAVTGYLVQRSDDYGADYYQIGDVSSSTTSLEDTGAVDNGYFGFANTMYEVQAAFPNGGLSAAISASVATNPPAPSNLSATVDSTGTNVFLAWSPAVGAVTGYTVLRGTYNQSTGTYSYSTIGTVGGGTTSFEDVGADVNGNANNDIYEVAADYSGGSVSLPDSSTLTQSSTPPPTYNLNVTAQMVRNQTGHWQLMFSSIPSTVQKIAFYWYFWDYFYDYGPFADTTDFTSNGQPLTTENDIPVSSITNGVYLLSDFQMTNWFPNNSFGKVAMIQPIGTNNQYGVLSQVGFQPYDSPTFVDGRQHLKQNLLYQLRSATVSQPNAPLTENNVWNDPFFYGLSIPVDTNYVESSIFHWSLMDKGYGDSLSYPGFTVYLKMDDTWPITANYQLHGNLYDTNFGGTSFNWQPNVGAYFPTSVQFQGTLATVPAPAVLGIADPYWISQGLGNLADVAAYESGNSLYLQSGSHNLYGLSFAAAMVNEGGVDYDVYPYQSYPLITLSPGGSPVAMTNADPFFNVNVFFSQTADPSLLLTNYYFAPVNTPGTALVGETTPVQTYPLPSDTGFANTNQTGLLVTSVGTPTVIGGWAKFSVLNSSSGKYAYLGQYFVTNAFVMTNGVVTTNTTGVASPYGDFFPTQPGMAAMVTMPDINTGQQGTGVVRVVALNVDANHDGTMDFTYQGPDFVSSSKPFRFWMNDSTDSGDFGGTGIPGQGIRGNGVLPINNQWVIHGRRDLVNYFPVYLNIGSLFQSNALSAGISATDTNWQFVLSQADGVLRFTTTSLTPSNYMNFLLDTNVSGTLASASLTTISNSFNGGAILPQSFVSKIATNNQGIILVEAAAATTQPLVLTIYHGANQIAQTSLPLSISGVEQMFRFKNLNLGVATNSAEYYPDRLTDASVPNEPDTTNKNIVFVHGYNVSPYYARGWFADIYKRLYWSGSHAKFYGVNWYGNDSQIGTTTPNYQTNVVHAFQTAPLLANFIATLTNNGPVMVLAHSLGNMIALSALSDYGAPMSQYFMLDAAVPMEAIDGSTPINTNMVTSTSSTPWLNYANGFWASEWFNVWPTNDARCTLSWNGRLDNFGSTAVYNFYSSGEEVLRASSGPPPSFTGLIFSEIQQYIEGQSGTFVWAWQEKDKGLMPFNSILSSDHGGWGLNENLSSGYVYFVGTPSVKTNIPPTVLINSIIQTNAFFDMSYDTAMFTANSSGSAYAQTNRNRILSDAIPALTLPVGANSVSILGATHNIDMSTNTFENGWPVGRGAPSYPVGTTAPGEWHHSDIRVVAYPFTYKVFNEIVTDGNLK